MDQTLLLIGFFLFGVGFIFRPKKKEEPYTPTSIQAFQEDFFDQFKLSQSKLQSLYAFDFSEVISKIEGLESRLNEIQENQIDGKNVDQQLRIIQDSLEKLSELGVASKLEAQTSKKNVSKKENALNFDDKTSKKIVEYLKLKHQGKSLDDIVKILQMEKGELLFLENLSKSIINS